MSRKRSKTQNAFVAASDAGQLLKQVAIARPVAIRLLLDGDIETENLECIDQIVGDDVDVPGGSAGWTSYCLRVNAAFALGIAMGQLVHPDVFKTGGAR